MSILVETLPKFFFSENTSIYMVQSFNLKLSCSFDFIIRMTNRNMINFVKYLHIHTQTHAGNHKRIYVVSYIQRYCNWTSTKDFIKPRAYARFQTRGNNSCNKTFSSVINIMLLKYYALLNELSAIFSSKSFCLFPLHLKVLLDKVQILTLRLC